MSTFDLKTIKHQCDKARARIAEGHAKIESLQHLCPHPKDQSTFVSAKGVPGSVDFKDVWYRCGVCDKCWQETP